MSEIALFEQKEIRRIWQDEKWYFSVVDVVAVLTDSADPRPVSYTHLRLCVNRICVRICIRHGLSLLLVEKQLSYPHAVILRQGPFDIVPRVAHTEFVCCQCTHAYAQCGGDFFASSRPAR